MKKKLLTLFMAMTMTAMLLSGCGETEESSKEAKANVEESKEDDKDKDEKKDEEKKESEKESEEETKKESDETESEVETEDEAEVEIEDEVDIEDEVEIEVEEEDLFDFEEMEVEIEIVESEDESEDESEGAIDVYINPNHYNDYFEKDDIISENVRITCTTESEEMNYDLIVETVGDTARLCYDLDSVLLDMYFAGEKVYAYMEMQGESQWVWAPTDAENDAESYMEMMDIGVVDTDSISSVTLAGFSVKNNVLFDVLEVETYDGTVTEYYVNRATQKIERCESEVDGASVVMVIEEIDEVVIPEEAETLATETTSEEVAMLLIGVLFSGAGSFE